MHSLNPPLLHRDLKIENILCSPLSRTASASSDISAFRYKLCDFGSTTYPATHPPRNKLEADALAYDLNRHTTLQYRSPEMVEPLLGLPVGLPSGEYHHRCALVAFCFIAESMHFNQTSGRWESCCTSCAITPHRLKNMAPWPLSMQNIPFLNSHTTLRLYSTLSVSPNCSSLQLCRLILSVASGTKH